MHGGTGFDGMNSFAIEPAAVCASHNPIVMRFVRSTHGGTPYNEGIHSVVACNFDIHSVVSGKIGGINAKIGNIETKIDAMQPPVGLQKQRIVHIKPQIGSVGR